jgi:hypothetical protein
MGYSTIPYTLYTALTTVLSMQVQYYTLYPIPYTLYPIHRTHYCTLNAGTELYPIPYTLHSLLYSQCRLSLTDMRFGPALSAVVDGVAGQALTAGEYSMYIA